MRNIFKPSTSSIRGALCWKTVAGRPINFRSINGHRHCIVWWTLTLCCQGKDFLLGKNTRPDGQVGNAATEKKRKFVNIRCKPTALKRAIYGMLTC